MSNYIVNSIELRILVKGKPITNYFHNGKYFVEGRAGSNFEIEVVNKNPFKIEAVLSVDGLSITDGQSAGPQSSGYLVEANSSIRIPGWKVSDQKVAAFEFTGKNDSYATGQTGSSANNGVIGLMAFKDKNYRPIFQPSSFPIAYPKGARGMVFGTSDAADSTWQMSQTLCSTTSVGSSSGNKGGSNIGMSLRASGAKEPVRAEMMASVNNLGTGFGEATEFKTKVTTFERGDMQAMMVMYYDNIRGLRNRGIDIKRVKKGSYTQEPQAFPSMNCPVPKDWKG